MSQKPALSKSAKISIGFHILKLIETKVKCNFELRRFILKFKYLKLRLLYCKRYSYSAQAQSLY